MSKLMAPMRKHAGKGSKPMTHGFAEGGAVGHRKTLTLRGDAKRLRDEADREGLGESAEFARGTLRMDDVFARAGATDPKLAPADEKYRRGGKVAMKKGKRC